MEIKVWSPIVSLLICFKKASKLKKNYTAQMKFIYKSNPYLLKNSRGPACCHVNLEKKEKLKMEPVSVCCLLESSFACNILCISGFSGKADEKMPRTGECTMRFVPAPPGSGRSLGSKAGEQELSRISHQ